MPTSCLALIARAQAEGRPIIRIYVVGRPRAPALSPEELKSMATAETPLSRWTLSGSLTGTLQIPPSEKADRLTALMDRADSPLTRSVGFVMPRAPPSSAQASIELLKLCGVPTKSMSMGSAVTPQIRSAILMSDLLSAAHVNLILSLSPAQNCRVALRAMDLASLLPRAILVA